MEPSLPVLLAAQLFVFTPALILFLVAGSRHPSRTVRDGRKVLPIVWAVVVGAAFLAGATGLGALAWWLWAGATGAGVVAVVKAENQRVRVRRLERAAGVIR